MRRSENEAASGELNIVPFLDIVTNLMLFLLATTTFVATVSEVRADLPRVGPGRRAQALDLSVTLTDRGAIVSSAEGRVCTTPMGDLAALTQCAAAVHAAHPHETSVIVSADPGIPYGALIGAMDAMRSDGAELLFPDVRISAGVR